MLNSFLVRLVFGRVDQPGMIAALASLRPRVQIPSRPLHAEQDAPASDSTFLCHKEKEGRICFTFLRFSKS
jgi:hypothetical protein